MLKTMVSGTNNFSVTNTTKGKLGSLPFYDIKNATVGEKFSVSLVFISDVRSQRLNREYRGKNKPANVLSFLLDKTSGEIFINLAAARREAPRHNRNTQSFVALLFIHALLHLKGMRHGSRMEGIERKLCKKFDI